MKTGELKERLIQACEQIVEDRLNALDKELNLLQESANEETKSSAGDKYETGRAMLMLEKEKLLSQKEQALQQLKPLKTINTKKEFRSVEVGAMVMTSGNDYFISSAIGTVEFDNNTYFIVSAMSPIAQAMLGKEEGQSFSFNGSEFEIKKIL